MRDHVLFYINGNPTRVRADQLFQSLSDFLRYDRQLPGTKVVCAEGDCGSCCVLLGQPAGDKLEYRNVTSCIQYLYQLDGRHVITVEGFKQNGRLSDVQDAMVRCQGSQCGYCTPGFIVSMHAMLETRDKLTAPDLKLGLSGNLCRCTGYDSIVRAGVETDASQVKRANELFPSREMLAALSAAEREEVRIEHAGRVFYKPTTVAGAIAFRADHPDCTIIAGGTDLGVVMNKGRLAPTKIMSVGAIAELRAASISDGVIHLGALTTLAEAETLCADPLPELAALLRRHGSPPIRNAGTVAGNIANGSPIGDTMPALMVLNAEVELAGPAGRRRVGMNAFYTGYRKTVMQPGELIVGVHIPLPVASDRFRIYKISRRYDLDISTFSAAFLLRETGGMIESIRIAYGGVGATIQRLHATEAVLNGQTITDELLDRAAEAVANEIKPISDVRSGRDYRLLLGANVLRKFFDELTDAVPAGSNGHSTNGHHANGKVTNGRLVPSPGTPQEG